MNEQVPNDPTLRLRTLAEKAAHVQDWLQDLEVALLGAGDRSSLKLLGELKRAWREFKDEALRSGEPEPTRVH